MGPFLYKPGYRDTRIESEDAEKIEAAKALQRKKERLDKIRRDTKARLEAAVRKKKDELGRLLISEEVNRILTSSEIQIYNFELLRPKIKFFFITNACVAVVEVLAI